MAGKITDAVYIAGVVLFAYFVWSTMLHAHACHVHKKHADRIIYVLLGPRGAGDTNEGPAWVRSIGKPNWQERQAESQTKLFDGQHENIAHQGKSAF